MKVWRCSLALAVLAALPALASCGGSGEIKDDGVARAAIVDQLYLLEPNPGFVAAATGLLETAGFTVDVWQGDEITVGFYRDLPVHDYEFILFRVHSGLVLELVNGEPIPLENTFLFTAEVYTTTRYVSEQLSERVSRVLFSDEFPEVFAVNSEFILKDSNGGYGDTVIIAMGCESHHFDDLPRAFVEKGAAAYIGWSDVVSLEYVDSTTLDLLENLLADGMPLAEGVNNTMIDLGHDPFFDAYLKLYPETSGGSRVREMAELP